MRVLGLLDGLAGQLGVALGAAAGAGSAMTVGGSAPMRPSVPTMLRVGSCSSRHQVTSVMSPKVQIMAMPEPLSGSASSWAWTSTSTPNSGVRTV